MCTPDFKNRLALEMYLNVERVGVSSQHVIVYYGATLVLICVVLSLLTKKTISLDSNNYIFMELEYFLEEKNCRSGL